jgi:uncharacterized membrane protein required for colicin V production
MIIDIILILFAITGFWLGYAKGILGTLLNITTYIIALVLTLIISPWLANFLSDTFPMGKLFALIFGTIGVFILLSFIFYSLTKKLDARLTKRKRSKQSKVLGGIVMFLFSIIIYGLLLGTINQFNLIKEESKQTSITYPTLKPIPIYAGKLVETFKPVFKNYWEMMQETMQQSKSKE